MELLVFGDRGTPVLVFPTSMGRFYQWEDFGMIAHLQRRIDEGLMQLWCVDSVDSESFYDTRIEGQDRARRPIPYARYLPDEVFRAIRRHNSALALGLVAAPFGASLAAALATPHTG